jgi:hypothetical protein
MLLQVNDTYIPISSIVALKKSDGQYALTFWSPCGDGDSFLRTVILTGDNLYEVESWLSGQIVVKVKEAAEGRASVAKAASDKPPFERRKADRRKPSGASRREART